MDGCCIFHEFVLYKYHLMKTKINKNEEKAALAVLRGTGVNVLEAALLAREAITTGRGRLKRARRCLQAGEEALRQHEKTVCFNTAVEAALEARAARRYRTLSDLRYLTRRLMKRCRGLAKRRIRSITSTDCITYLRQAFNTPRQRNKARLALSSVFSTAFKRGWCAENPILKVEPELIHEKRIDTLTQAQVAELLHAAETHRAGSCLPAVGIMLYAGVRPHEVERLTWAQIQLERGFISILPQHSKTGGARHVTIHPPLAELLSRWQSHLPHTPICPSNWRRSWAELHRLAGWHPLTNPWQEDILRHTFATHHLSTFRSYTELQLEMGHRSSALLRTRYIAMSGDTWQLFAPSRPHQ